MKTERMAEQQVETRWGLEQFERRKARERNRFITSGIEEQSDAMACWSVSPTPIPSFRRIMPEVAEALSHVEIVDPNIAKRVKEISRKDREMTENDKAFTASVALARAKVIENEGSLTSEEKKGLEQFKKSILSGVGKAIVKVGGGKALSVTTSLSFVLTASCSSVLPTRSPETTRGAEPVATEITSIPTEVSTPEFGEIVIAPSPTQENIREILLSSASVMSKEEIQEQPLLSDEKFTEGLDNYVEQTKTVRSLTEENTTFELIVIRGETSDDREMLFPFATWIAQNQEGKSFVEMIGVADGNFIAVTLERQELEKDGIKYFTLVLKDAGPIFAILASEIENENTTISFSPSGKALEEEKSMGVSKALFSLIAPEVQKGAVLSKELVAKWEEMGYPKDLREGGTITTVEKIINGQKREFLAWRVGWTMVYTDKELVNQDIDFISSETFPDWDEHKYSGEMVIPNPNEPGAPEQIEMLGAFAHAINLGIIDRSQEEYDPAWYGQYLAYLKENPDSSYVLEANVPVPGKPGSYKIGEVGTINASLPIEFVILPYRMDRDRANGPEQIFGGHPQAPFGLEWAERSSGYLGIDINENGGLTALSSNFLVKGELGGNKFDGPLFIVSTACIVSAPAYIRTAKISMAPGPDIKFTQQIDYIYYKDYGSEDWPQTPNLIWGVPK